MVTRIDRSGHIIYDHHQPWDWLSGFCIQVWRQGSFIDGHHYDPVFTFFDPETYSKKIPDFNQFLVWAAHIIVFIFNINPDPYTPGWSAFIFWMDETYMVVSNAFDFDFR